MKTKYVTEEQKKQHFKEVVEKAVGIIDRQLYKLQKVGRGRTYIYTLEDVEKIERYLIAQIGKTIDALKGKKEERERFTL